MFAIWNAINDPAFAWLIDNTTRSGADRRCDFSFFVFVFRKPFVTIPRSQGEEEEEEEEECALSVAPDIYFVNRHIFCLFGT